MNDRTHRPRRLLACVGNASRWKVVAALADGEQCVTELALRIRLSQSCTTRHLQALVREGVVRRTREGKRVVFALRHEDRMVRQLLTWAIPEAVPPAAGGARSSASGGSATPPARPSLQHPAKSGRSSAAERKSAAPGTSVAGGLAAARAEGDRSREEPPEDKVPEEAEAARESGPDDDMEDWLL